MKSLQAVTLVSQAFVAGAALAAAGIALGLVGAISLFKLITKLLYGVEPTDALTIGAVSAILFTVALPGCYFPARRASVRRRSQPWA